MECKAVLGRWVRRFEGTFPNVCDTLTRWGNISGRHFMWENFVFILVMRTIKMCRSLGSNLGWEFADCGRLLSPNKVSVISSRKWLLSKYNNWSGFQNDLHVIIVFFDIEGFFTGGWRSPDDWSRIMFCNFYRFMWDFCIVHWIPLRLKYFRIFRLECGFHVTGVVKSVIKVLGALFVFIWVVAVC